LPATRSTARRVRPRGTSTEPHVGARDAPLLDRKTLHYADIAPLIDDEFPDAGKTHASWASAQCSQCPCCGATKALGAMFLYRHEPGLFTPDQVALVETFARQAAIALHNVRQFRATQDALEQQTATSEILRVISSARDDVQPVFDTIAQLRLTLCRASSSLVVTLDGGLLHIRAFASTTREARGCPARHLSASAEPRQRRDARAVHDMPRRVRFPTSSTTQNSHTASPSLARVSAACSQFR
jgi:hypothetical protein